LSIGEGLLRFGGSELQASISMTNIVLLFVPLVSLVFGTSYLFSSREFTELILTQPINRTSLFFGLYGGLSSTLALGFVVGLSIPFLVRFSGFETAQPILALVVLGVILTLIFVSIAFLIASLIEDKVKAMGLALFVWFTMSLLFDGIVLVVVQVFRHYPLETPITLIMISNPVDLARVCMLLILDASAMMGYTGATIERFIGSTPGILLCCTALIVWIVVPLFFAWRSFDRKDF
jgi:Cu-processing system permease protein